MLSRAAFPLPTIGLVPESALKLTVPFTLANVNVPPVKFHRAAALPAFLCVKLKLPLVFAKVPVTASPTS